MLNAIAVITGTNGQKGTVSFSADDSGTTTVKGNLYGLPPGDHALIIRTYGNVTNGCESTGPPFTHAGAEGVVDKITVDVDGNATFKTYGKIPLSGPDSVIGRGLVLHSNPSPDFGDGVAWGVIGLDA